MTNLDSLLSSVNQWKIFDKISDMYDQNILQYYHDNIQNYYTIDEL